MNEKGTIQTQDHFVSFHLNRVRDAVSGSMWWTWRELVARRVRIGGGLGARPEGGGKARRRLSHSEVRALGYSGQVVTHAAGFDKVRSRGRRLFFAREELDVFKDDEINCRRSERL